MSDKVTVIIPTYNRAKSLGKAIRSVLDQTVDVCEVLVCDDGSSDESLDVVNDIADPRVRWLSGEHCGKPAIPRNRGIREGLGDWLAFIDDDDEWLPEKLEKQIALANSLGCLAVCSNAFRVLPKQAECEPLLDWQSERLRFTDILEVNRVICSSVLVRRTLFDVAEGFPETSKLVVGEDYALWLRVATFTDFAYVSQPLLSYWDDPENSVRKEGQDYRIQRKRVLKDFGSWASRSKSLMRFRIMAMRQYAALVADGFREFCSSIDSRLTLSIFK